MKGRGRKVREKMEGKGGRVKTGKTGEKVHS
jgi:hypothetical protein